MPFRTWGWVWAGRLVALLSVAGLIAYLARAGLDNADKLGSVVGAVLALVGVLAPYLLTRQPADAPSAPIAESAEPGPKPCHRGDVPAVKVEQVNYGGGNVQNNRFSGPW
jgi:hypothetical protein